MARSATPTLLSLQRWAAIMGLSPVHFAGAYADTVWRKEGACEELWPQYSYQGHYVAGREDVAQVIADAEEDIARILGYYPAPKWIVDDHQIWTKGYRWGAQAKTRWGKVVAPGRRVVDTIALAEPVTYFDNDNDGFFETAVVIVPTDVTDKREIKLYFSGNGGDQTWEIRPLRSITLNGGLATIEADSWLFIKPELWEAPPSEAYRLGINISTNVNFVETVDVCREYTSDENAVEFMWLKQYGCDPSCDGETESGCFSVVDPQVGIVQPLYRASTWECKPPANAAKFWYLAGEQDQRYLKGETLDPLSLFWAQTIAWLATARLELPPCACGPAKETFALYQNDRARVDRKQGLAMISLEVITNPFGTRFGEIRAWERVVKFTNDQVWQGGVL